LLATVDLAAADLDADVLAWLPWRLPGCRRAEMAGGGGLQGLAMAAT
jgi:hypothetical protein